MASKISYFILFEILIFAKGKPTNKQDSNHDELQYGLKKLVEDIIKQGTYDVMVNHHEDHPGTHHEDITQITYNGAKSRPRHNNEKHRTAESARGASGKNLQYNDHPSVTNLQNFNLYLRKRPETVENNIDTEETKYKTQTRSESENIGDVLEFLNDLDKTLKIKGNNDLELRCSGNRCGESRDENGISDRDGYFIPDSNNYGSHLRCNGRSCSIDRGDDRNDRESLRCYGNRCSRKSNYRDDNVDEDKDNSGLKNILRCTGDRCALNGDDNNDDNNDDRVDIDSLRCVGDRCGLNGNYDRDGIDYIPCVGDRCDLNRNEDGDRIDSLRCVGDSCGFNRNDDRYGIDSVRCVGDRCGLTKDDDVDDDRVGLDSLRCVGDRCGLKRDDDDDNRAGIDFLRCVGDRCGLNRDDYDDNRADVDSLYCVGDRCSLNRDNVDDDREGTDSFRCIGDRCGVVDGRDATDTLRCVGDRCGRNKGDDESENCIDNICFRTRNDDENEGIYDLEAEELADTFLSRTLYSNLPQEDSLRDRDLSLTKQRRLFEIFKRFKDILKEKITDAWYGNSTINQINV